MEDHAPVCEELGSKLRPSDDGLEACSFTIRLDLQDADYVIALALQLGERASMAWIGKTLDLSKAYKHS